MKDWNNNDIIISTDDSDTTQSGGADHAKLLLGQLNDVVKHLHEPLVGGADDVPGTIQERVEAIFYGKETNYVDDTEQQHETVVSWIDKLSNVFYGEKE
jgi:hypothetical protein